MRHDDCSECQRLWRDYADATTTHVRLDANLRLAALERNLPLVESLTAEVEEAAVRRAFLRDALQKHEAAHEAADASESSNV